MLNVFIPKLVKDMDLGNTTLASQVPGTYALPLGEGITITMTDIANGFIIKCLVAHYPKTQEEAFSTQALLANLFGQGTRGAALGLSADGNTLTLTRVVDYAVNYKEFREILEDFITVVDFWREEATKT